ncbi:MAG: PstS family phosphate ABC transporter substrate-binding protein, partial [Candidatus Hodarchaeota archaeon]
MTYWYFSTPRQSVEGTIEIDGSSTVYPITQAVAEEFLSFYPNIYPVVGVSGTGGGFKRFIAGETDISDASRPIKASEAQVAAANGIEYIEFEIALDGIAIVTNQENNWVDYLTVEELDLIWNPDSLVDSWNDIRPGWPDQPIRLYGPGTDSGTFDYFTEVIVGESGASRADYTASEDDNVLVQGIAGDKYALGYFGYAYYAESADILKIVPVDSGIGPVAPADQTINSGQYSPLSRPLFIYVSKVSLKRQEVANFVRFYMETAEKLVT